MSGAETYSNIKVLTLFKMEKHLSDYAVVCGDENFEKTDSLSEGVQKVVIHEELEQSQCTTASLELIITIHGG